MICNRKQGRIQWVLLLNLLQLPLYHYSDLILVYAEQTPFYSMRILLIFTNRDGRKGLESPQQREKHRYTFCRLAGQSPWSCRVISASLRNEVRRVRHDLSVLLFIYRLFHGKKKQTKKNQKKRDGRLFPFWEMCPWHKPCVYSLPGWDPPRYRYHLNIFEGLSKPEGELIPPTDFRGFCPSMILSRIWPSPNAAPLPI